MSEFAPIVTLQDLAVQDEAEVLAGYQAGLQGDAEPCASTFSRSYQHGWRNGAVDGGHQPKDDAQARLARAFSLAQLHAGLPVSDFNACQFPIQ